MLSEILYYSQKDTIQHHRNKLYNSTVADILVCAINLLWILIFLMIFCSNKVNRISVILLVKLTYEL
jgi:hypothetical protein